MFLLPGAIHTSAKHLWTFCMLNSTRDVPESDWNDERMPDLWETIEHITSPARVRVNSVSTRPSRDTHTCYPSDVLDTLLFGIPFAMLLVQPVHLPQD